MLLIIGSVQPIPLLTKQSGLLDTYISWFRTTWIKNARALIKDVSPDRVTLLSDNSGHNSNDRNEYAIVPTPSDICDICGQSKSSGMTGSFTQWVNACRCELIEKAGQQVRICALCGKQIDPGSTGSFTQWVLQSQNCSCPTPVPLDENDGTGSRSASGTSANSISGETETPSRSPKRMTSEIADLGEKNFPLERYKPINKLGMGGGGLVYLCFDKHLRKNVAVKILHVATPELLLMFQAEARVTAKFKHPNIVEIIDFGLTDGRAPFMVLEYVDGKSLDVLVAERGPLPERVAAEIFDQIAAALEKGHDNGIFHRDVKGANVIITQGPGGEAVARVIDFGIAMMSSGAVTNFHGLVVVGTPKYMCPDQLAGLPFDARSDMYSLGCVMYETLTGQLPFFGNAMMLLEKHQKETPPKFEEVVPHLQISSQMEHVVRRCLKKKPDARYADMKELRAAIRHALSDDQVNSSSVMRTLSAADLRPASSLDDTAGGVNVVAGGSNNVVGNLASGGSTGGPVVVPDAKSHKSDVPLMIAIIAVPLIGALAFGGFLLFRHDDGESVRLSAVAESSDKKNGAAIAAVDKFSATACDDVDFDKFDSVTPIADRMVKLAERFNFVEAEHACNRAIELDKSDSKWYRLRGIALMNQGKYDAALRDLNQAVKIEPDDENYRARAEYYFNCAQYKKADDDIHSAIEKNSSKVDNFILMARIHSEPDGKTVDELERAQRCLDKAVSLEPERVEPYALRLIVDFKLENKQDLEKTLAKVRSFRSDNALLPYCLASYSALTNDWKETLKFSLQAAEENPAMWQAYALLGNAYKHLGEEALEKQRVDVNGESLSSDDCNDRASSNYHKAASLNPKNGKLLFAVSRFHADSNRIDSEIKYLSQAIAAEPTTSDYYQIRAEAYRKVFDANRAVADCDKSIELGNKNSRIYLLKGNALADLHREHEAEQAFTESIRLKERNPNAYLCRAELRARMGDYKNAIADFDAVLNLEPGEQRALNGKVVAFKLMRKYAATEAN